MITKLFTNVATGIMSLRCSFAQGSKYLAQVTCPSESYDNLQDCYKDAEQIRSMVLRITMKPNLEVGFMSDFFEMRPDGFRNYSDLLEFWAEADKAFARDDISRIENPSAFKILRSAKGFTHTYRGLPRLTQGFLNASLALQKAIIIRHIEAKSAEFVPLVTM